MPKPKDATMIGSGATNAIRKAKTVTAGTAPNCKRQTVGAFQRRHQRQQGGGEAGPQSGGEACHR